MVVRTLELKNYRNYEDLSMELSPGTNILYGDNAQGKTNILEAIYLCATTKSHRGTKDRDIINFDSDESHIRMQVVKDHVVNRIDMHLKRNRSKGVAINGIPIKKSSELFGSVNVVFFSPEDLGIIKNGPAHRRRFIDMELCQLDRIYYNYIYNYNRIVEQRNNLLRQIAFEGFKDDTLDVWDAQLVDYGNKIMEKRDLFIERINHLIFEIHQKLTGGKEELYIKYEPSVETYNFEKQLKKSRDNDLRLKTTTLGPHRDDISFFIKDVDIRKFGSQGQQRTAALSLKLSEIELVKKMIQDQPVLLLDDVLSELDSNRQNYLLDSIKNIQTVITCTGLDEFVNNRFNIDRIYKVEDGRIYGQSHLGGKL